MAAETPPCFLCAMSWSNSGVSYHFVSCVSSTGAKLFIREKEEDVIFPDGTTDAAAELIELIVVALQLILVAFGARSVVALVCVQTHGRYNLKNALP